MSVEEKAPAKLNLGLKIVSKRKDGCHNILSIFQTVDLYDELHITSSSNPGLVCDDPDVPTDGNNLIIKAEDLFKKELGITLRAYFSLKKVIPIGAGLAGGSSDAAAALRGLTRLYGFDISESILHKYAGELGSDIPFLLKGGTAIVSGRGGYVTFVEWPFDFTYVIVYPGFGISTAWAYGNIRRLGDDKGAYKEMTERLKSRELKPDEFFDALHNDFETIVCEKYPELQEVKNNLIERGARAALLTGSGSSMFGIFEKERDAYRCARMMNKNNHRIFIVKKHPGIKHNAYFLID
ncbi:MAG TPA: 4-(cytidine 5'-diphospho)-2-C-methyl-D-erythritol kinase [Anaerolineae bacterium]|nr:4-(cytidine 5'-diphospho)-2-C-methyl-D-erythritol kinase [Anaerolineae bacterium]